jgi:hypothetical protein
MPPEPKPIRASKLGVCGSPTCPHKGRVKPGETIVMNYKSRAWMHVPCSINYNARIVPVETRRMLTERTFV